MISLMIGVRHTTEPVRASGRSRISRTPKVDELAGSGRMGRGVGRRAYRSGDGSSDRSERDGGVATSVPAGAASGRGAVSQGAGT